VSDKDKDVHIARDADLYGGKDDSGNTVITRPNDDENFRYSRPRLAVSGEYRIIISAMVNFQFTNMMERNFSDLVNLSQCSNQFRAGFSNRPKDNNTKSHSYVRSANDFMKLIAAQKVHRGNVVIDIGSKYVQTARMFYDQRVYAIRDRINQYDDDYIN